MKVHTGEKPFQCDQYPEVREPLWRDQYSNITFILYWWMPCAITEVWPRRWFEATCWHRPPEGETLQMRRVPQGKLNQFLSVVYFRFEIYFICSISKEFVDGSHLKRHFDAAVSIVNCHSLFFHFPRDLSLPVVSPSTCECTREKNHSNVTIVMK